MTPELLIQGSPEWHAERRGKVTASEFVKVKTEPRGKADREAGVMGDTARTYLFKLAAETLTGQSHEQHETEAMRWGHLYEPEARAVYSELTGRDVREVGFLVHPDLPEVGGSPDGLVGDDGGLEIKCPFDSGIHCAYIEAGGVPKKHVAQVQGHLWITDRDWWDFVSYDPRMRDLSLAMFRVRVYRDGPYIEKLAQAVTRFRDRLLETLCTIKGRKAA